jgi:hypothetical protein
MLRKCKNKKSTLPLLELAKIRGHIMQIRLSNKINMENVKLFRLVCFLKNNFRKIIFQLSYVCLLLRKLINEKHFPINEKHFPVKEKFGLVSKKVFSFYFERKTLSGNCEKFRNVILFADYIKFGPQTFDCYIYFVLNIYFSISSLII